MWSLQSSSTSMVPTTGQKLQSSMSGTTSIQLLPTSSPSWFSSLHILSLKSAMILFSKPHLLKLIQRNYRDSSWVTPRSKRSMTSMFGSWDQVKSYLLLTYSLTAIKRSTCSRSWPMSAVKIRYITQRSKSKLGTSRTTTSILNARTISTDVSTIKFQFDCFTVIFFFVLKFKSG